MEIDRPDEVGVAPRKLALVGLLADLGANLGHRQLYLDAGLSNIGHQCTGKRTIDALLAIERGLPGAGRECDPRALAGFHFGQTGLNIHAACAGG
jgi:hypothetical protein